MKKYAKMSGVCSIDKSEKYICWPWMNPCGGESCQFKLVFANCECRSKWQIGPEKHARALLWHRAPFLPLCVVSLRPHVQNDEIDWLFRPWTDADQTDLGKSAPSQNAKPLPDITQMLWPLTSKPGTSFLFVISYYRGLTRHLNYMNEPENNPSK